MTKLAALAVTLLLYSPSALAWGGLGHEAICELAFRELDDTARQRVTALSRLDEEFTTFRAACNWADRPRQRATEHFVNLPRDATGLDDDECPLAEECVVSAILPRCCRNRGRRVPKHTRRRDPTMPDT